MVYFLTISNFYIAINLDFQTFTKAFKDLWKTRTLMLIPRSGQVAEDNIITQLVE